MSARLSCQWVILAEDARKTPDDRIDIRGIFNVLAPSRVPVTATNPLFVVAGWKGPPLHAFTFQVQINGPRGFVANVESLDGALPVTGYAITYSRLDGGFYPEFGDYVFAIVHEGVVLATVPLAVVPRPERLR